VAKYFAYLTRSQLAIAREDWVAARDDLREAVRYQPAGAYEAHLNLAQVYRQMNHHSAALDELARAIASAPDDARLYYTRARVYLDMRKWFFRIGAGTAVGIAPGGVLNSLVVAGVVREDRSRENFEEAITRAAGTRPLWLPSAHVELGYLKHLSRQYDAALADFDAALKLDSNYAPAYRQRAETLLALGRPKEATEALDAYLARAKPDRAIHRARGLISASLRQYTRAIESYTLALGPQRDLDVLAYRGWAYLQAQSLPSALADFKEVLDANPRHADALCGRGHIRVLQNQVTEAIRDAEQALKYGRQTATLLCNVACIYARAAQYEQRVSPRRARTARLHEDQAAQLVIQAVRLLPAERKQRFWREQVEKEGALQPLLRHPELVRLAREHGW
jgi:tetratricopeptide (TPR) repeat protein